MRSRRRWRAVVSAFSRPVTAIGLVTIVAAWAVGLTGLSMPLWAHALPAGDGTWPGIPSRRRVAGAVRDLRRCRAPLRSVDRPWLGRCLRRARRSWLGPSERRSSRSASRRSRSRTRVVDAADEERRRIERDLHDGAQQRLVALAVDLGRARARLRSTRRTAGASASSPAAHEEAKQALAEIAGSGPRASTRGAHRPRSRRRAVRDSRRAARFRSPSTPRAGRHAVLGARGGHRVLRRRGGADQRRQARVALRRPAGRAHLASPGRGCASRSRRRSRRRRRGRAGPARAGGPGRRARRQLTWSAQPGGRTVVAAELPCGRQWSPRLMLLREGAAPRLLDRRRARHRRARSETPTAAARGRAARRRRLDLVDHRRPDAADAHRRGPARRARDPQRSARRRRSSCSRSTSRSATPPTCSPADGAGSATCSRTGSPTSSEFLDALRRVADGRHRARPGGRRAAAGSRRGSAIRSPS